jgi:hypothetical protein
MNSPAPNADAGGGVVWTDQRRKRVAETLVPLTGIVVLFRQQRSTLAQLIQDSTVQRPISDDERTELARQAMLDREAERDGLKAFFKLRDKWSRYIFILVCAMLAFQMFITTAVGLGWMDFSKYEWFINLILGENFVQVVGMGYIVVKYLFPQPHEEQPSGNAS